MNGGGDDRPEALGLRPEAFIFSVALAVRLIISKQLFALPLYRTPQLDSQEYLGWAQRLAEGTFFWPSPPPHGPGYPLFLALLLRLSIPIWIAQSVLGALTSVFVAIWTARTFGRAAGIAAGVLLAIYGPLVWIDGSLFAES